MAYKLSDRELNAIISTIRQNVAKTESTPTQPSEAYLAVKKRNELGPEVYKTILSRGETNAKKLDMQKKKEDRMEAQNPVDSVQIKRDRTSKDYESYTQKQETETEAGEDRNNRRKASGQSQQKTGEDPVERRLRAEMEQAEKEYREERDQEITDQNMAFIAAMSEEDRQALELYVYNRIRDQNLPMDVRNSVQFRPAEQEAADLLAKIGKRRADELAESLMREQNAKLAADTEAAARNMANGLVTGTLANIATVPFNVLGGFAGSLGRFQEAARRTGRYSTLDPNEIGTVLQNFSGAVRGQTAENINEFAGGGLLGTLASAGYQGVMAMADNVARVFLGGGAWGGAGLAAMGSFSQAMADASRQGATPGQAALMATGTALIEALSEKLPLDNLITVAKGKGGASAVLNVLRQAGIEILEEEASLVGTLLLEAGLLQEKSGYNEKVNELIVDGGLTPAQAKEQAAKDLFWEVINTALVSGISGGLGGFGAVKANENGLIPADAEDTETQSESEQGKQDSEAEQETETKQEQQKAQGKQAEAETARAVLEAVAQEHAAKVPKRQAEPVSEGMRHVNNATAAINNVAPQQQAPAAPVVQPVQQPVQNKPRETANPVQTQQQTPVQQPVQAPQTPVVQPVQTVQAQQPIQPVQPVQTSQMHQNVQTATQAQQAQTQPQVQAQPQLQAQPVQQPQAVQKEAPKKGKEIHFWYDGFARDTVFFNDSKNQGSSRGDLNFTINDDNSIDLDLTGKGDRYNSISNWIESDGLGYLYNVYADGQLVTNPEAARGYYNLADAEITARPVLKKLYGGNLIPDQKGEIHFYSDGFDKSTLKQSAQAQPVSAPVAETTTAPSVNAQTQQPQIQQQQAEPQVQQTPAQTMQEAPVQTVQAVQAYANSEEYQNDIIDDILNGDGEDYAPWYRGYDSYLRDSDEPGIKGTGAAEQNFTGTAAYENLLSDDNVQEPRKGDVRQEEVPVTDTEGKQVSKAAGNIMNSGWTPDAFTDTIKKMVQEGKASHAVMSNESALKNAAKEIENEGGAYNALQSIKEKAAEGWTSPAAVAKAELIYYYYADEAAKQKESGNVDDTVQSMAGDAFVTLAQLATSSGQATQLFSVFRRMTPEGQMVAIQKNVQRYIEGINRERSAGKKAAANKNAKKTQKPVDEAVKTARKEVGENTKKAAARVKYKGGKVTVEGNQHGEPFVFEYAQKVGEALAKGLENSRKPKPQKTFLQTMTGELRKFAAEKMPPSQKNRTLTATELLRDYIQNQEFYAEAWEAAQLALREKHGNDPAYQEFINSGIGVESNANPRNKIMAKAIAASAMETGETADILRRQQALGITGTADTIAFDLIQKTGATGEMAQTIRDAAMEFVENRVSEAAKKPNAKTYDPSYFVNEAMREIRQTMSDVAKKNTGGRENVKQAVIRTLTFKYGFAHADADHIAEVVSGTFDQKAQEQARKLLEQKFGEREQKQRRSAGEMVEEYANLGAFAEDSQYSEKATESFLRAAMQDIGKTVSDMAKSGKADREAVKAQISDMITQRHGIDKADADHIADVVSEQLSAMVEGKAREILEKRFANRPAPEKKTAMQMLTEYGNLGAFDAGSEYNQQATARVIGDKFGAELNEELVQNFLNAKNDEEKAKAMDDIYRDVASQISPTIGEAWDAWRNMAMLFNFKTHARNFLSTGAFKPYPVIKRNIGALIESVFVDRENRTKAILGVDKNSRALVKWAKEDAKSTATKDAFKNYATGGNEAANAIREYRKYMPGFFDWLAKSNMSLMEAEDALFKRSEYSATLASFLKARGYTAEQVQSGSVPYSVMNEGRQLAINEAMKATFNDRNKFSDAVAKFRVKGNSGWSKAANALAKGLLPYTRTPANVVVRVKEYSPIEIATALHTLTIKVKNGEATVAQGIDQLASGLTGTGMMVLGGMLREGLVPGVKLIGKAEEEEKEEGAQDWSIKIGDKYYGIGFLAPACIPLFIGAEINRHFPSREDFVQSSAWDKFDALLSIGSATLNPMLELSVLSSLNGVFSAAYNSEEAMGDRLMAAIITAATNYFTQGLPTILGQAEQASEDVKTTPYINTDNPTEATFKQIAANASQRIPGFDWFRTTKLDEWGQPVTNDDAPLKKLFDAFVNPFTVTEAKTDPLTQEIIRLNKAQSEFDVKPDYPPKKVTYTDSEGTVHKDVRLTEAQYQTYATTQGQTARSIAEALIGSDNYNALSDEQKAEAFKLAYQYAREKAEQAAIPDSMGYSESWMMEVKDGNEAEYIINKVGTAMLSGAMGKLDAAWDNGYSAANQQALSDQLRQDYDSYKALEEAARLTIYEASSGTTRKYLEARSKGVSHDDFLKAAKAVNDVKGTGKYNSDTKTRAVRDIDTREAIARTPGLSPATKDAIMRAYMPDYDPKASSPDYTELKYAYIREKLKLSPQEYARTYRAVLDNPKDGTDDDVLVAMGYDPEIARTLAGIYNSTKAGKAAYMDYYNSKK